MSPSTILTTVLAVLTAALCVALLVWTEKRSCDERCGGGEMNTGCPAVHESQNRCVRGEGHLGFHKAPAPEADVPSNWYWDDGTVKRCTVHSLKGEPCTSPTGHTGLHYSEKDGSFEEPTHER